MPPDTFTHLLTQPPEASRHRLRDSVSRPDTGQGGLQPIPDPMGKVALSVRSSLVDPAGQDLSGTSESR